MNIHCFADDKGCHLALASRLVDISQNALSRHSFFSLVLAGGSTPEPFYRLLASADLRSRIDWSRAQIFFGDERCVPGSHVDSNYRMARKSLLDIVNIPDAQIYRIDGTGNPRGEAERYQRVIEETLKGSSVDVPGFDFVLLGVGSDGHTASLFPGGQALSSEVLVTATDPPAQMEPKVARISLTLNGLALSRNTFFLVRGESKKNIVKKIQQDKNGIYPASLVCRNRADWYLSGMDCSSFNG